MIAYYNERDPYAAQWLRNLMEAGHIAWGWVDERDIRDVRPDEIIDFTQCHFFAGIGVWSHALRRAGWSDNRPIWTGSCPCQPFSAAGRRGGVDDERHLWPHWHYLIDQCRPPVVIGEQVASKDGLGWLDLVQADLEGSSYAVGASDLCAAGFGGAHIRQRLYFVGVANADGKDRWTGLCDGKSAEDGGAVTTGSGGDERLANALPAGRAERGTVAGLRSATGLCATSRLDDDDDDARSQGHPGDASPLSGREGTASRSVAAPSISDGVANPAGGRIRDGDAQRGGEYGFLPQNRSGAGAGDSGTWAVTPDQLGSGAPMLGRNPADWLFCRDGKWRPVRPGSFPLAHAAPARVGRLRAYGNALDAETATGFVEVVKAICDDLA